MKVAVVDSRREATGLDNDFDKIFVLSEAFQHSDKIISLPGTLDGSDRVKRDTLLESIGRLLRPSVLNASHSRVLELTGFRPATYSALFELNIFSRFREFGSLASVSAAGAEIRGLEKVDSVYVLSKLRGCATYLRSLLPGVQIVDSVTHRNKFAWRVRDLFLPARELAKGAIWLCTLCWLSISAKKANYQVQNAIQVWQHRPSKKSSELLDSKWSQHWRALSEIEDRVPGELDQISFSQGSFFDANGRRVRYLSATDIWKIFLTSARILVSSPLAFVNYLDAVRSSDDVDDNPFADFLRDPIARSLLGPIFVQGIWDSQVISKVVQESSPSSILYLAEFQPWEASLVSAAKFRPGGAIRTYGVAHTAVRPWDLRYFRPITWFSAGEDSLPLPHKLLVTSTFCEHRLREHWSGVLDIGLVETLRYPKKLSPTKIWRGLLVAMPYTEVEEREMLGLVSLLSSTLGPDVIKVQPHPLKGAPKGPKRSKLALERPNLFLTDTTSTVLLEAIEGGVPTVAIHCGPLPNMSAVADHSNFETFHKLVSSDLLEEIGRLVSSSAPPTVTDYYKRDPDFALWRKFFSHLSRISKHE